MRLEIIDNALKTGCLILYLLIADPNFRTNVDYLSLIKFVLKHFFLVISGKVTIYLVPSSLFGELNPDTGTGNSFLKIVFVLIMDNTLDGFDRLT